MYSSQLLKGTFETIILKLLSENDSLYGYELMRQVKALSDGDINLPFGSLYPILHKMEKKGLVLAVKREVGRRTRLYYSLTSAGREEAKLKVEEFMRFARTMITLLKPQD